MAIDNYLNLVTSQHRDKTKFIAWLSAALNKIDDCNAVINSIPREFDLDYAAGTQLDIIGEIIGRKRTLDFQPQNGFSSVLDDDTYRLVLKAKIAQSQWNGTIKGLYDIWDIIFPLYKIILTDNQDMTITVVVIGLSDDIQKQLISHRYIIPKALGVTYNYSFAANYVFAYDIDNSSFKGYDQGYWTQYV